MEERYPGLSPVPILAHMVEDQTASSAGTPHCTTLLLLVRRSCIPQAGQQLHPPWHPAQGFLASDLGESLAPFLSPQLHGMQEHPVEDEWVVGSTSLPPWVFIEKQVCI